MACNPKEAEELLFGDLTKKALAEAEDEVAATNEVEGRVLKFPTDKISKSESRAGKCKIHQLEIENVSEKKKYGPGIFTAMVSIKRLFNYVIADYHNEIHTAPGIVKHIHQIKDLLNTFEKKVLEDAK